jgi:hypothetical protein
MIRRHPCRSVQFLTCLPDIPSCISHFDLEVFLPTLGQKLTSSIVYACGCTTAGVGPRIIHVNCHGVPLGKIRCDNMSLNPKYPEIECKCRNCIRDDVLMKDAKTKTKPDNSIMNQAQGWIGEQAWEDISKEFVASHSPTVKKHLQHSRKVRKGVESENPDDSWSPSMLPYPKHTTSAQKHKDVAAALSILKISKTPVDLHALNCFDPAINQPAAASKGRKPPMKLSSTRQQNARHKNNSVPYIKPAVSPRSASGQKLAAEEESMNTSYKAKLLEEAALVKVRLEQYGLQLDAAGSENNPSQLKLLHLVVDDLKQMQESLDVKIALTEEPRLSWNTQEKIINSSEPAKALMQKEAEKEAIEALLLMSKDPVSFLPRLKRSGGSSKLVAQARPKIEKKTTNTTSDWTRVEHVMKETCEYGWDMLDEFEDQDWVDLPSPKAVKVDKR